MPPTRADLNLRIATREQALAGSVFTLWFACAFPIALSSLVQT